MTAPRRVQVGVYKWNPAWPGYTGAALVFLAVFFVSDHHPVWWASLLAIAAGFVMGLAVRRWWNQRR